MKYYTTDLDKVVEALQEPLHLFEVNAKQKRIRRKTEVKQVVDMVVRTVYAVRCRDIHGRVYSFLSIERIPLGR